mgnify:CR=1 FL=1|jgi:tripartite motif-containing protein 71|tara:strand:- start:133 stop:1146 length:1014 start_codon:yes stop_codon:yes gene_type:complete
MKKVSENTKITYSHTVGFTADVGGRGFHLPRDMSINSKNKLYVVNRSGAFHTTGLRISIADIKDNYYGEFSKFGKNPGELYWPCSITFDSNDNVYVTDEYTNLISIFDTDGKYIKRWGEKGSTEGKLNFPSGIDSDNNNNLYICDNLNNRVQVFTKDGNFIKSWGREGNKSGEFDKPWGIKVYDEIIMVADWRNDRIQIFDKDGNFLDKFGDDGNKESTLFRPSDVAKDKNNYYYVSDWGNQRVQIYNDKFEYCGFLRGEATLSEWAKEYLDANVDEKNARETFCPVINIDDVDAHEESARIESYFWDPTSVIIDKNDNLLVLDSNRNRIQIYHIGE